MEVTGIDLKTEGGEGRERALPPRLPQSQLPWALLHNVRALLCSAPLISGELRASCCCCSLSASPSLVCSLTSIISSFPPSRMKFLFLLGPCLMQPTITSLVSKKQASIYRNPIKKFKKDLRSIRALFIYYLLLSV